MTIRAEDAALPEALTRRAREDGKRPALLWRDRVLTWGELEDGAARVAGGLGSRGVEVGDIVALASPNLPELLVLYFAVQKLGATALLLNLMLSPAELGQILADARPCAVAYAAPLGPLVSRVLGARASAGDGRPDADLLRIVLGGTAPGAVTLTELAGGGKATERAVDPESTSTLLYKAGADGVPRGVMLTHGSLLHQGAMGSIGLEMTPADRTLLVLPNYHVFAIGVAVQTMLHSGGSLLLMERFEPEGALRALEEHRATILYGVPTMYAMMLRQATQGQAFPDSLRVAICGAAPLPVEVAERFRAGFGVEILEGYGLTEASGATAVNPWYGPVKPGTIGIAIPGNEMRVVGEAGRAVPVGERGELVVRGPNVMKGYLRRPDATAAALRDGWLHTGDIGSVDGDGYFTVHARKNDLIIVGGENVYPSEVEAVLREHPSVREVGVVGVRHGLMGEVPEAFVVERAGAHVDAGELVAVARERLAKFKVPRTIHVVKELPLDDAGRVVRSALASGTR
ncbi:MAG: AMP-binding protein [Gemmatimonadota bacterium]